MVAWEWGNGRLGVGNGRLGVGNGSLGVGCVLIVRSVVCC